MRIRKKDLDQLCELINRASNLPNGRYSINNNGIAISLNVGSVYIDHSYQGYRLVMVKDNSGQLDDVLNSGYLKRKILFERMTEYIDNRSRKNV